MSENLLQVFGIVYIDRDAGQLQHDARLARCPSGGEVGPFLDLFAHTLRLGRDYGLGDMQATLGARMAEPLARNELTPAFDPRRYLGVGPRIGLEGNKPLQSSWIVEWKVGASVLSTDRTFDTGGGVANPLPSNTASSGSALNVDGLLGLSYWFDSAAKLTVGYRADYFKTSPTFNITLSWSPHSGLWSSASRSGASIGPQLCGRL